MDTQSSTPGFRTTISRSRCAWRRKSLTAQARRCRRFQSRRCGGDEHEVRRDEAGAVVSRVEEVWRGQDDQTRDCDFAQPRRRRCTVCGFGGTDPTERPARGVADRGWRRSQARGSGVAPDDVMRGYRKSRNYTIPAMETRDFETLN